MRSFVILLLSMAIVHSAEQAKEIRVQVERIVPEGIIAFLYKKTPVGGGSGLGGHVGWEWTWSDQTILVTGYRKEVAEGEKIELKATRGGVKEVNDGGAARSLRVYEALD